MKKFTKAWDKLNGCTVDVRDLPLTRNGLNCDCTCVECKQPVEACQGNKRSWYFRHASPTNCKGGPMTALHLLAQHLLVGHHTMKTKGGEVSYSHGVTEYAVPGSQFEADVAGDKPDGSKFLIEIYVTHKLFEVDDKVKFIREQKLHAIEINLSKVDPNIRKEDLLNLLLNETRLQKAIYSPPTEVESELQQVTKQETGAKGPSLIEGLIVVAVGWWIINKVRSLFRPTRRKYY
ncbi:MAG: hypothetical protein DYG99_12125 [Bacteroidetes bacterium CHB5]|nr:hypothetical protein [Bacteroidetes bacterium CHB5]